MAERFGPAGVAIGIVLVALGLILEESSVGLGSAVRTLGGVLFLGGLAAVLFGNPRHRAVTIGISRRVAARYMASTANWRWPDRVGAAGVAIGLALVVPALVLQISFRSGAVVALPAVVLFWSGVGLLIYGRFYRRGATRSSELPSPSSDRRRGRGSGRR